MVQRKGKRSEDESKMWKRWEDALDLARKYICISLLPQTDVFMRDRRLHSNNCVISALLVRLNKARGKELGKLDKSADTQQQLTMLDDLVTKTFRVQAVMRKKHLEQYIPGRSIHADASLLRAAVLQLQHENTGPVLTPRDNTHDVSQISEFTAKAKDRTANNCEGGSTQPQVHAYGYTIPPITSATWNLSSATSGFQWNQPVPANLTSLRLDHVSNLRSSHTPFSTYASTSDSPFQSLHQVKTGRIVKNPFSKSHNPLVKSEQSRFSARTITRSTPEWISSKSSHEPASGSLQFGDRIDQALRKLEKWIDVWLSGAFDKSNQDLAWESFEFCLSMSDLFDVVKMEET